MIRLVYLLRRKPEMSLTDFQEFWLSEHAPVVASCSSELGILRYVQTHTVDDGSNEQSQNARGGMEPHYDGLDEFWWESEADLEDAVTTDTFRRAMYKLLASEEKFIDLPASPLWFAYEYPQVNPTPENVVANVKSTIIKTIMPIRQQEHLTDDEARRYWLTHHGWIIRSHASAVGSLCYRQIHRADSSLDEVFRAQRGTIVPSYLGHAEAWFHRSGSPMSKEATTAVSAFFEDEHRFIDMKRSTVSFGNEHVIVDKK